MAKKAKKASKSKKAGASGAKGGKTVKVPLHSVVHFMNMIRDQGHTDQFVKAAKKSKLFVSVPPGSVKFVSGFLARKKLHTAMAKSMVDPCPGDPFDCKF